MRKSLCEHAGWPQSITNMPHNLAVHSPTTAYILFHTTGTTKCYWLTTFPIINKNVFILFPKGDTVISHHWLHLAPNPGSVGNSCSFSVIPFGVLKCMDCIVNGTITNQALYKTEEDYEEEKLIYINTSYTSFPVWWLVLGVLLNEWRDTQIAGKAWFLGVSVRVFWEEIGIWVSRLSGDYSPQCGWALRACLERRGGRKRKCVLSAWAGTSLFSCPWTSALLILGPSYMNWITPPGFLDL